MHDTDAKSIPLKGALRLIGVLFGVLALVIAIATGLVQLWQLQTVQEQAAATLRQPPRQNLETAPQPELKAYLAEKKQLIEGYAWIDKQKGLARIPLNTAMRAAVEMAAPMAEKGQP